MMAFADTGLQTDHKHEYGSHHPCTISSLRALMPGSLESEKVDRAHCVLDGSSRLAPACAPPSVSFALLPSLTIGTREVRPAGDRAAEGATDIYH